MVAQFKPKNAKLSIIPDALPPMNLEAEEAVLGGILIDPSAIGVVADILPPDAFYVPAHRQIFIEALKIHEAGSPVDLMTVTTALADHKKLDSIGGMPKLAQLVDRTISSTNIQNYSQLLLDKYVRRLSIEAGAKISALAHDTHFSLAEYFDALGGINEEILQYQALLADPLDREIQEYNRLTERVREIEQTTIDPGLKLLRMENLSRETGYRVSFLSNLYLKSLTAKENEGLLSLAELKEKYGSQVQEWFMHGFAPKASTVLLHAHGGTGKTRLIYDWIYHMVTGMAWNGNLVTARSRKILIVQTDESQGDLLSAMDQRGFTDDMPIRIKTRWTVDHIAALRLEIEEWNPDVILIDSLTSVSRHSLFSENDTEYARPILELRDIAQEFGCCIFLIHHSNSEGKSRGSKAIVASVSHVFSLSLPSEGSDNRCPKRILLVEKSRSRAPEKYEITFNPITGGWDEFKACKDDPEGTAKTLLKDYLAANRNQQFSPQELAPIVGFAERRTALCLFELSSYGEISRQKDPTKRNGYIYWLDWEGNGMLSDPQTDRPPRSVCEIETEQGLQPTKNQTDRVVCKKEEKLIEKTTENFTPPDQFDFSEPETKPQSEVPKLIDPPDQFGRTADQLDEADQFGWDTSKHLDGFFVGSWVTVEDDPKCRQNEGKFCLIVDIQNEHLELQDLDREWRVTRFYLPSQVKPVED